MFVKGNVFLLVYVFIGMVFLFAIIHFIHNHITNKDVSISEEMPVIFISDRYERLIHDGYVLLTGNAVNASRITVSLNGNFVYVDLVNAEITEELIFQSELKLIQGSNTVKITAISVIGRTTEKTMILKADFATPEEDKPIPLITAVSINEDTEIYSPIQVNIEVKNGATEGTILRAFVGDLPIDSISNNGGTFSLVIDPVLYNHGQHTFHLFAENIWGKFDEFSLTIFIINNKNPIIKTNQPQDIYAKVDETVELQLNTVFISDITLTYGANIGTITGDTWAFSTNQSGMNYVILDAEGGGVSSAVSFIVYAGDTN